jgi:hypothetical protein
MSYYILSSLGINIYDLFNISCDDSEKNMINENFNNLNKNDIETEIKKEEDVMIDYEDNKNIETFKEEHFIKGTDSLLFPLIEKVYNQNGVANVNSNVSRDIRGDIPTNLSTNYTPFYSN